jgi:hypothetical protein
MLLSFLLHSTSTSLLNNAHSIVKNVYGYLFTVKNISWVKIYKKLLSDWPLHWVGKTYVEVFENGPLQSTLMFKLW